MPRHAKTNSVKKNNVNNKRSNNTANKRTNKTNNANVDKDKSKVLKSITRQLQKLAALFESGAERVYKVMDKVTKPVANRATKAADFAMKPVTSLAAKGHSKKNNKH